MSARILFKRFHRREASLIGRMHRQGVADGDPEFGWRAQTALVNAGGAILPYPMVMMLHEMAEQPALQQRVVDEDLYAAVVKETLRLHPAVPTPARVIKEPVAGESAALEAMASGEGSVFINLKAIHRHPRGWTRPDEFIIDRWLPGWTEGGDPAYRVYAPFGLGVRTCPSAAVSPKLLEMFLRAVLSKRVVSNPSGQPPRLAEGTLGMVRYPFTLEFTERLRPAARQSEIEQGHS
jgi:cytochrome P450/NADPH-cytochrome P450 reductase